MSNGVWTKRIARTMIAVASGTTLLGTSCGAEVRDSVIAAGADFVGSSFATLLQALVPVEDLLQNGDDTAA